MIGRGEAARLRSGAAALLLFLFAPRLHAGPVTALTFCPDNSVLVSNGDRCVEVRSPKDAAVQRKIACDLPKILSLAFAPHGRLLAAAGGAPGVRGEACIYSWPEGKLLRRIGEHSDVVTSVAFNSAGTHLGLASADHTAHVWNISPDGTVLPSTPALTLTGHAGPVLGIAFSPSGASIITASADRSLKVWSADAGKLLRTFSQHTETVNVAAFRPGTGADGGPVTCASGSDDRTVRVWQPEIGRMVRIIRQHEQPVLTLAWEPGGGAFFSAGKEGVIRRIDAGSDAILSSWKVSDDWIYSLAVSPDGSVIASGDWPGVVRIRSLRSSDGAVPD